MLYPWVNEDEYNYYLVLFQPRNTGNHPDMTENCSIKTKISLLII